LKFVAPVLLTVIMLQAFGVFNFLGWLWYCDDRVPYAGAAPWFLERRGILVWWEWV
jgi:hypothetical protein